MKNHPTDFEDLYKDMAEIEELRKHTRNASGNGRGGVVRRDVLAADCDTVILGAGPYGLAAAAHLRAAGVESKIFGSTMSYWRCHMPRGMMLRSPWPGCHISDPRGEWSLDSYGRELGIARIYPLPLERFIDYGEWFQRHVAPDLDPRQIVGIENAPAGFRITLEDGAQLGARHVVVAAGLAAQEQRPPAFAHLPAELVTHSADYSDFARFAGLRVAVVGAGQAALESAVLLAEAGASVDVLARCAAIRWLGGGPGRTPFTRRLRGALDRLNPPAPIGPFPLNWLVEKPGFFRMLPWFLQRGFNRRVLRPAGAAWLVPRTGPLRFRTSTTVTAAREEGGAIELTLNGADALTVDHVILCTGYRVDIAHYRFLAPELLRRIRRAEGYPVLDGGLECSVPRLHFLGAPAARDFGPLMRFVAGTGYAARRLTRAVASERTRSKQCQPVLPPSL